MEKYELIPLKELLEVIQQNLAFNIDTLIHQANQLIGKEKQHNLGFRKEQLKEQIENYLKIIIKNVIYQIETNFNWREQLNEAIKD